MTCFLPAARATFLGDKQIGTQAKSTRTPDLDLGLANPTLPLASTQRTCQRGILIAAKAEYAKLH